ncbi:pancreatic triacylglycerol lipase-like [Diaphorina citri]|uniref:Pancreatic triacylglycerol lipase-like n=1 Tax=Diaphorina citri TaxID=121845 RepID=A0A3Q0J800_DIACI|nr:pancreatic triacylglycerol lipase-like [Diaphorina citri]
MILFLKPISSVVSFKSELTRQLLIKDDVNVIVNNWGAGSSPPYTQAVANIRLVGYMTAVLLNTLRREVGIRTEYVHLIGHSLGAHLSGYVGSTLRTVYNLKLGRITGLDPADPYFSGTESIVRLDPTDATFVDIVHTDAAPFVKGGLGMGEPIGHLDFYPNGGENQPGCDQGMFAFIHLERGSVVKGLRKYLGCDHIRSYEYFTESVNARCPFIAVECDTWDNFHAGNCFNCLRNNGLSCAKFGLNAVKHRNSQLQALGMSVYKPVYESKPSKYFLITGDKQPFCRYLYRVTVFISNSTASREHGGEVGKFSIEIHGTKGKTDDISLFKEQFYKPGAEQTGTF